jgi:putative transposase
VRRKYRRLFSSSPCPKQPGPKGPREALIEWWTANLRILEIDEVKTVPHVPLSHPFVERLIGTMQREFLDHVLFWNARDQLPVAV